MATMLPTRWRDSFDRLREEMDRLFDRWLPRRMGSRAGEDFWFPSFIGGDLEPAVDIHEDDKEIVVTAELPGLKKDDFSVDLVGDRLTIRGEKKTEREERKRGAYYCERSYGSFSRTFVLPCEVQADKAEATYKDGVLTLRLPKTETAKPKQIAVKVE
ncbi:MAG: Hsp20/alpha crystallin family protein [Candidatus Sumerlaeia bacterium]|nr:Hsp20/alpha crystallin family protein [Candidatus Sumerlaeia bacterium]